MGSAVVSEWKSTTARNMSFGWEGFLGLFKSYHLNKKQATTFPCVTWMHFALHSVTGQLMPKAKPEIPSPFGASRLSPHKHIQTDTNTDDSAIQE